MKKRIMSGNEAVALGVYEAGARVAAAYPGTPSTEILENIAAHYQADVYCQWACNEKVAFEIALGASIGGARAFCAFKHVGMNVAADPVFSMGYAGVGGGLVFVSADDPGCHSSQNEQDNRWYAPHAKICMLEPGDSAECRDFILAAFQLSERFDTPVMLRMTTRVCHSKSAVIPGTRQEVPVPPFVSNPGKYVLVPANARKRHAAREQLLLELARYAETCPQNRVEQIPGNRIGVVTSGVCYQYAREVFGEGADYLKLGMTYPLPEHLLCSFCEKYETLYVIEENDSYLENNLRARGFTNAIGKSKLPVLGELNAPIIRAALLGEQRQASSCLDLPVRPPVLCPGCPHRGFFYGLQAFEGRIVSMSDIGCYALGAAPPLNGFSTCICMGAGFSGLIGLAKALEASGDSRKALGSLGDSTFFHSGITGLVDIVTSNANVIAVVLDNSITAMTGHQQNPGTSVNLMGEPCPAVDIRALVLATGLPEARLRTADPLDIPGLQAAIEAGLAVKGPFVILAKHPCALLPAERKANGGKHCRIDPDRCRGCKSCMKIACPAILFENGKARIFDENGCNGCGLCRSLCRFNAIERVGASPW